MSNISEQLRQQEEAIARIRGKRTQNNHKEGIKKILNILFLALATVGLIIYYAYPQHHISALIIIGTGMLVKVIEIFRRIMM